MADDVLIRVNNVSKRFCRSFKKSLWYGATDIARELLPFGRDRGEELATLRASEFWAVDGASFELRRGECLGLIGRNGAGKTTLLKMLNALIKPDGGRIEMRGRVGALIALGAGFNPILTGRENVYVNGSILGLTKKEIDRKLDEIIDFAEIGEFIDAPVQSYSSGMYVKLGFAVAASLSPDVLLIDEVLAVGDAAFRFKCLRRMGELRKSTAMILVSHNMQQIALACSRALVMSKGRVVSDGSVDEGIEAYEHLNEAAGPSEAAFHQVAHPVVAAKLEFPERVTFGQPFQSAILLEAAEEVRGAFVLLKLYGRDEALAAEISTNGAPIDIPKGTSRLDFQSEKLFLKPGTYVVNTTIYATASTTRLAWFWRSHRIQVDGKLTAREAYHQVPAVLTAYPTARVLSA
jgi:lipopolysaccharide transport system ATP-binding protein